MACGNTYKLKFRAWDGERFVSDAACYWDETEFVTGVWNYEETFIDHEDRVPVEVFLNTGLKCSAGKEIYEGDILKHPDGTLFVVKWDLACSGFRAFYGAGISSLLVLQINSKGLAVVIGNIKENPELMEKINGTRR